MDRGMADSLIFCLGGQLKTGNLWTGQNPQFLYGRDQSVLLRNLLDAQIGLDFGAPAERTAFEHVRMVQQPIEERRDRRGVKIRLIAPLPSKHRQL